MTVKRKLIHCVVDREPQAYHDADRLYFAVNLSLECERSGVAELAEDVTEAVEVFSKFLEATANVATQLALLEIDPATNMATCLGDVDEVRHDHAKYPRDPANVLEWLKSHAPTSPRGFWTVASASALEETVSDTAVGATHLLRGSHAWSAPVAHGFGLTRLGWVQRVKLDPAVKILVVLPHSGVIAAGDTFTAISLGGESWEFELPDQLDALEDVVVRVNQLQATEDPPRGFVDEEGYLLVNPDAPQVRRVLDWFELGWSGVVDSLTPVLELKPGRFGPSWPAPVGDQFQVAAGPAIWRLTAAMCASLSTLVTALLRPTAGPGTAGEVLLPLVVDIVNARDEALPGETKVDSAAVTAALRELLRKSTALKVGTTHADQVRSLRKVLALEEVASDTAESRAFNVLLGNPNPADPIPLTLGELQMLMAVDQDRLKGAFIGDPLRIVVEQVHKLHEEAGLEQALLRWFEDACGSSAKVPKEIWNSIRPLCFPPDGDVGLKEFEGKVHAAWRSYVVLLGGSFNGEEAARRSANADFTHALLTGTQRPKGPSTAAVLVDAILESRLFSELVFGVPAVGGPPPGVFAPIAGTLPRPAFALGDPVLEAYVQQELEQAYLRASSPVRLVLGGGRFLADSEPKPLPIQVSALLDASELDDFQRDFNGICVAVRRIDLPKGDAAANPWAHTSLAELSWLDKANPKPDVKRQALGLYQWLPAANDNRAPMFIDFNGFPLASSVIAQATEGNPALQSRQFYTSEAAVGAAPIPQLAYGRKFEAFSFATTNSGSLPKVLQAGPPWLPTAHPTAPKLRVYEANYQRRTAVGSVNVSGDTSGRIGGRVPGVLPLSGDYPRMAIRAEDKGVGVCDLLREAHGPGMIELAQGTQRFVIDLADLQWHGDGATVLIEYFDKSADVQANATWSHKFSVAGEGDFANKPGISVMFRLATAGVLIDAQCGKHVGVPVLAAGGARWWIRLSIIAALGDRVSLSFADPRPRAEAQSRAQPVLLLAPSVPLGGPPSPRKWLYGLDERFHCKLSSPRVGYLDFDRWVGNRDLRKSLWSTDPETFLEALLNAYVRMEALVDPGNNSRKIAQLLAELPDPAVHSLQVDLVCVDSISATTISPVVPRSIDLAPKFQKLLKTASPPAKDPNADLPTNASMDIDYLRKHVVPNLDSLFFFEVEISSEGTVLQLDVLGDGSIKAVVPPGVVAELRISPCVKQEHFIAHAGHPAVFHEGVKSLAIGQWDGSFLFPGESIRVEAMVDGMPAVNKAVDLAAQYVQCAPRGISREYDVVASNMITDEEDRRQWRLFGEATVDTQRWRQHGRPIYASLAARDLTARNPSGAVRPLVRAGGQVAAIDSFEAEVFFDRKQADAKPVTQTLAPQLPRGGSEDLGSAKPMVLDTVYCQAPSATYLRHSVTFHSRYAGALVNAGRREVQGWTTREDRTKVWPLPVAVLADLSRVVITRPQLRAIMPLTEAPSEPMTPPALALLQEPPYSEGGLADRLGAAIKLGFGYGFRDPKTVAKKEDAMSVGILDARKEIGPDPRLTYRAMDASLSLSMALRPEGPIGLTFDGTDGTAAAFPNSAYLLAPAELDGSTRPLEEHFMGVTLLRYLDPAWVDGKRLTGTRFDAEQTWWLDIDLSPKMNKGHTLLAYGKDEPLITVYMDRNQQYEIHVGTNEIDAGGANAGRDTVAIALLPAKQTSVHILHAPVAPRRYSASVFCLPAEVDSSEGGMDQPVLVAAFEWSPKKEVPPARDKIHMEVLAAAGTKASRTTATSPTFLAWTRTSRDFRLAHVAEHSFDAFGDTLFNIRPARTGTLRARREEGANAVTFHEGGSQVTLSASTVAQQVPIHVHRHIAVVATRRAKGIGRPMNVFALAADLGPLARSFEVPAGLEAHELRIVEYECPASILGAASLIDSGGIRPFPDPYKKSYFDMRATGALWETCKTLFIRFVGSRKHLDAFSRVVLRIERSGNSTDAVEVDLQIKNAVGAEVILAKLAVPDDQMWEQSVTVRAVGLDGKRSDVGSSTFKHSKEDPGFVLSLAATEEPGELWTDISMLHSPDTASANAFDFGRLFSSQFNGDPASAVLPQALAGMEEAQARIIAVSPPFPIQ